jgi:hypothetical protein
MTSIPVLKVFRSISFLKKKKRERLVCCISLSFVDAVLGFEVID